MQSHHSGRPQPSNWSAGNTYLGGSNRPAALPAPQKFRGSLQGSFAFGAFAQGSARNNQATAMNWTELPYAFEQGNFAEKQGRFCCPSREVFGRAGKKQGKSRETAISTLH
jgi:hypothetical protein